MLKILHRVISIGYSIQVEKLTLFNLLLYKILRNYKEINFIKFSLRFLSLILIVLYSRVLFFVCMYFWFVSCVYILNFYHLGTNVLSVRDECPK